MERGCCWKAEGAQLVKKFSAFYGTVWFITEIGGVLHLTLG